MTTIKVAFTYEDEQYNLTALLKDNLDELSRSKRNQACDIIDYAVIQEDKWSLLFDHEDTGRTYDIELEMKTDPETGERLTEPTQVIIWESLEDGNIAGQIDIFSLAFSATR